MKHTTKLNGQARIFSQALKSTFCSASLSQTDYVAYKKNPKTKIKTVSTTGSPNVSDCKSTEEMVSNFNNPTEMEVTCKESSFPANLAFATNPSDLHSWVENSVIASFQETLCMDTYNENDIWIKNSRLRALQQLGCSFPEFYSPSTEENDICIANKHLIALHHLENDSSGQYFPDNSLPPVNGNETTGGMSSDAVYTVSDYGAFIPLPKLSIDSLSSKSNSSDDSSARQSTLGNHKRALIQNEEISEWSQKGNFSANKEYSQVKSMFYIEEKSEGTCKEGNGILCENTDHSEFEKSQLKIVPVKNSKSDSISRDCCGTFYEKQPTKNRNDVGKLPSYDVRSIMAFESKTGFFDSHCHIDMLFNRENFFGSYADYMAQHNSSYPASYKGCVTVFCKPFMFAKKHLWLKHLEQDNVWGAFGCHPKSAKFYDDKVEKYLEDALSHPKVKALGEIGLDYSIGDDSSKLEQHFVFRRQLQIARKRNLRLVIHCREADDDTIQIMREILPKDTIFHLHCFTGTWERAQIWIEEFPNVFIGITNLVTFPSAWETHEVARKLPLERLLLETDAPYFVPSMAPKGTSFSHPGMAIHVAAQIAAIRNIPVETILNWTSANTKLVYNIP